jgi:cell division protease FtsH
LSCPYLLKSGPELRGPHLGDASERIRKMFEEIKNSSSEQNKSGVLIIDEFDSIGRNRNSFSGNTANEESATVNQLLTEIDGGNNKVHSQELAGTIFIIAITNHLELLDPALLRAGRFSRHILVDLPNKDERIMILETYKTKYPFAADVDFSLIVEETVGFSGADLAHVLQESALSVAATKMEQDNITMSDILTTLAAYKETLNKEALKAERKKHASESDEIKKFASKLRGVFSELLNRAKL